MKQYMSASGVKTHHDCPKQWWFKYASDYEPVESDTKYLDLGNAVHDTLEQVLSTDPPEDWDSWDEWPIHDKLNEVYKYVYRDTVPDEMVDTGYDCLEKAADYLVKRSPALLDVEAEYEFDVDRPDLQQKFKGKLDVATTNEIWDWKTGSIRDDTAEKEKIQGAVYMAAYRVAYGHSPEAIRFVYLKEGQVRTIEPSTDTWQFMLSHARNLAKSIRTENFEAKPGDQCYWCDFEQFCPAAGGIGADFSWEAWMA